jgi:hypothetical protein
LVFLLSILVGIQSPGLLAVDTKSRDIGEVTPACKQITFITSLNNDDDDYNKKTDLKRKITKQEDNLRKFVFTREGASKAYILEPIMLQGGTSAIGKKGRVRAYGQDKKTRFKFNQEHTLPAILYLEGIKTSSHKNDFGFEYDYRTDSGNIICGGGAQGTVINITSAMTVASGHGNNFQKHNKMLITAIGNAVAQFIPQDAAQISGWKYDGAARIKTPNALKTSFMAGQIITPANLLGNHELRFRIKHGNQIIESHLPVNITAPIHATAYGGWTNGMPVQSRWINASKGNFSLLHRYVAYTLLDQFRDPIKKSAWGNRMVQIRENIGTVMTSPLPRVRNWINNSLNWTQNWKNKPTGKYRDSLEATRMAKYMLLDANSPLRKRQFDPSLVQTGGIMMNLGGRTHIWEASVNGNLATPVTENTFNVTVSNTRQTNGGTEIQFNSSYTVITP